MGWFYEFGPTICTRDEWPNRLVRQALDVIEPSSTQIDERSLLPKRLESSHSILMAKPRSVLLLPMDSQLAKLWMDDPTFSTMVKAKRLPRVS